MWKQIKPEDTERENRVLIPMAGTRIGRRSYAIGRCYVAGRPAIAVKAGREKQIGTRGAVLNWLTERGLSMPEARKFVRSGLENWDLGEAIRREFARGTR